MATSTVLLLVAIAIFVCIALNYKLKVNIGTTAIIFAWIIGYFCVGMKVNDIVKGWPTKIAFQLIAITMFFSFPQQNGTLQKVADNFVYTFRKHTRLIPWVIFAAGFVIGGLGAPGATGNIIMGVIGYAIGEQLGIHPLITAFMACTGAAAGSELPWSAQGIIAYGVMSELYPDQATSYAWSLWLAYLVMNIVGGLILCAIFGGFKKRAELDYPKPEPLSREQKNTLLIIACVVGISLLFPIIKNFWPKFKFASKMSGFFDLMMLAVLGTFIFTLLKYGDQKTAITKGVPWNTIWMLSGMAMLMNVADAAGATDFIAGALSGNLNPGVVVAVLGVLAGVLSFFSGGMSVVFPMLSALVPAIASATGINPGVMFAAICCGARLTAISPFSTGGALIVGANPNPKHERILFNGCLAIAFASLALVAIFAFLHLYDLMVFA